MPADRRGSPVPSPLTRRETLQSLGVGVATAATPTGSPASTPPETVWSRTYDPGDGSGLLVADVAETAHGVVVAGVAPGERGHVTWVAGVDARGNRRWQRRLGRPNSAVRAAVPGDENRVYLVGVTNVPPDGLDDGHPNPWLVAVRDRSDRGAVEWDRTYQPDAPGGAATTATATSDGVVLAGVTDSDGVDTPWVAQVDRAGTLQWDWHHDDPDGGGHAAAVTTVDGDVVVGGSTRQAGGERGWVARLTGEGQAVWTRTPETTPESRIESLAPDGRGGVVALGNKGFGADDDGTGWLVALDGNGRRRWQRTYSTPAWGWLGAVAPTGDGYSLLGSRDRASDGRRGAWLLRVGPDGRTRWERLFAAAPTRGFTLFPLAGGGLLLGGERERDGSERAWLAQIGGTPPEGGTTSDPLPTLPPVPGWSLALVAGLGIGAGLERLRRRV